MKSYLKFLSRNKLYTAIEAAGLIVSLAFVVIIATSVRDQMRVARGAGVDKNICLVGDRGTMEYRETEELKAYPEIVETAGFATSEAAIGISGDYQMYPFAIADRNIFDMVGLEVLEGNLDSYQSGGGVVITSSAARRYFPDRSPIGEAVTVGAGGDDSPSSSPIIAVVEDPEYSILGDFEFASSPRADNPLAKDILEADFLKFGGGRFVYAFARMAPGTDLEAFSGKFVQNSDRLIRKDLYAGKMMAFPYESLFYSSAKYRSLRQGNRLYLVILIILGIILLASAILNYINLSSAISGGRAKEMATRRLIGAGKGGIFVKILLESILFTLVCYLLALLLAGALIPTLNSIRPADLSVPFRFPSGGFLAALSVVLVLATSLLAGIVPALLLSSHKPIDVVTGKTRRKRKMSFNKILIITQAALALVLIGTTLTLETQLRHLESLDLGADIEKDLYFFMPRVYEPQTALADKIASSPLVEEVAFASSIPTHINLMTMGPEGYFLNPIRCDSTSFRLLGFRIVDTYEEPHAGTLWIPEELRNVSGVTRDNPDIKAVMPYNEGQHIGGVVENIRLSPANGVGSTWSGEDMKSIPAVEIVPPERNTGLLIKTTGDHKAFNEYFRNTASEHFKETTGISNFLDFDDGEMGYIDDIIAQDYDNLRRYIRIIEIFTIVAILLAMLGLLAMSTFFASMNSKDIAIRKVFGGTVETETRRSVLSYMLYVLIAAVIATPVASFVCRKLLESYPERISGYWWIFVVAAGLTLIVSFASVLWQTLSAARTNPATELKKE